MTQFQIILLGSLLTFSAFTSVIAPKEAGAGKIEIQIDGQTRSMADLSTTGARQAQQVICKVTGLTPGNHAIAIVNRGPGPVAVDVLLVRQATDEDKK